MITITPYKEEKWKDGDDFGTDQKKYMRITILGVIIAGLAIIMQIFLMFIYPPLFLDIILAGYLFILIGMLLGFYGYNNYRLSKTNPEIYLKWKDPMKDIIKVALSLIFIILIAAMLGSNLIFTTLIGSILPEGGLFLKILAGLLIGLSVGFFAAKNLYIYKTKPEEYQVTVNKKKKREKESIAITISKIIPMEKTYNKIVENYWQVFGYCIIGALFLIVINYIIINFISNFFFVYFVYMGSVEQLFIIGGFVILQSRKIGFFILQIAIVWLIIWIILVLIISAIGPFLAIFLV